MGFEILRAVCPHWYIVKMEVAESSEMLVTTTLHILTTDIVFEYHSFFKILDIYILILIWKENCTLGEAHLLASNVYIHKFVLQLFLLSTYFIHASIRKSHKEISDTLYIVSKLPPELLLIALLIKA